MRHGEPWDAHEEALLIDAFGSGRSIESIADVLERSEWAIICRLVKTDCISQMTADEWKRTGELHPTKYARAIVSQRGRVTSTRGQVHDTEEDVLNELREIVSTWPNGMAATFGYFITCNQTTKWVEVPWIKIAPPVEIVVGLGNDVYTGSVSASNAAAIRKILHSCR